MSDPSATPASDPTYARPGLGTVPRIAKFRVGDIVKHRYYPFRGIIFDIDPVFNSTEDWWQSIPQEIRPAKSQPYYHLLAENAKTEYVAYVSEQNLLPDTSGAPLRHPQVKELFVERNGTFEAVFLNRH
jgi:heat shock protein HspQ